MSSRYRLHVVSAPPNPAASAIELVDRYAFELLVLAYEFDHYFPGLLESASLQQTLEVTLPARVAAAYVGLAEGAADAPLETFVDEQLQRARTTIEAALDISEVTEAFDVACDALYLWLRRYDCIDAEVVAVAVLLRRQEQLLLTLRAESGSWGLPLGRQQQGENSRTAAVRTAEEELDLVLSAESLCGAVAQSYDYDEEQGLLCLTLYLLFDCEAAPEPKARGRCQEVCFVDWERLLALEEFTPNPETAAVPLTEELSGLLEAGIDFSVAAR